MRLPFCSALLLAIAPSFAAAQTGDVWTASLMAGPSSYDLDGTGTSFAAAMHVAYQWEPAIVVEAGMTYFRYRDPYNPILFPEFSVQFGIPRGPLRPYLGAGMGLTVIPGETIIGENSSVHRSLHGVAGMRVLVGGGWGVRGELRVRSPQQWGAVTSDVMFGVTRRFR
jgi:hypothetical protein